MTVTSRGPDEIALPDGGELIVEEAGAGPPVVLIGPERSWLGGNRGPRMAVGVGTPSFG